MTAGRSDMTPIYTIGYGSRSIDEFVAALQRYDIHYVVDIRSAPYSRYKPEFNKDALERALTDAGFRYVFMGDTLGGRPDDAGCYDTDGKVDYERVKTKAFYHSGLERITTAFEQQQRIVLMCSEGKPQDCHRSKLIGVSLHDAGVPVEHIDEVDEIKTQEQVLVIVQPQPSLFEEFDALTSRKKYAPTDQPHGDANSPDLSS